MSSHHYIPRSLDGRPRLTLTYCLRDMVPISHDVTSQLSSLCSKGVVGNPVHMCFYAPLVFPAPNVPMPPTLTLQPSTLHFLHHATSFFLPLTVFLLFFRPLALLLSPVSRLMSHVSTSVYSTLPPRCCTPLSCTCILLDDLRLSWALTLHFTLT